MNDSLVASIGLQTSLDNFISEKDNADAALVSDKFLMYLPRISRTRVCGCTHSFQAYRIVERSVRA